MICSTEVGTNGTETGRHHTDCNEGTDDGLDDSILSHAF